MSPSPNVHRSDVGSFETQLLRSDRDAHINLIGELDIFGAECLTETVRDFLASSAACVKVALDLSHLSFVDLAGIRAIRTVCDSLESSGLSVSIHSAGAHIEHIATLAEIALPLHIFVGDTDLAAAGDADNDLLDAPV